MPYGSLLEISKGLSWTRFPVSDRESPNWNILSNLQFRNKFSLGWDAALAMEDKLIRTRKVLKTALNVEAMIFKYPSWCGKKIVMGHAIYLVKLDYIAAYI